MRTTHPRPKGGQWLLGMLLLVLAIPAASAATYHVRSDGGNASQCNGLADSAYPGSGSNQDCAWSHPFMALPPGGSPRIDGGDTLLIGDGSYRMGHGAPGAENCSSGWPWECHMPKIPSGPSPDQPTRILGAGHGDQCQQPPELWGTERASMVVNLEGSSNVEVACLEVTDRASCAVSHCHNGQCDGEVAACDRGSFPYGDWASTGVSARDSSDVVLRDLHIHGLANRGINAGRIHDWTLERVRIRGNGWAGWDGTVGSNSANSGEIRFYESEIGWNGCIESWPDGEMFGCWGQGGGGWGDGLGTSETGGHWIFEDSTVHHNTSDGIDLLYLNDDGQVTIRRTLVNGNAGNQIKVSRSAVIENSVVIGNCAYFADAPNMHDSDQCRAFGDAIYTGLSNNAQTDLINNTIIAQGNCAVSGGGGSSASRLRFINNLIIGKTNWNDPSKQSCVYYSGSSEQLVWDSNFVSDVRNGACPGDSLCDGSPGITDSSLAGFDVEPVSGSPLIAAANADFAPGIDYHSALRGEAGGPDIGAIERVTEASEPPVAEFNVSCKHLDCSFDAGSSGGDVTGYSWQLGDASAADGVAPSHAYAEAGSYTVTLTVTEANGLSDSVSQTIQVTEPPVADPSIDLVVDAYSPCGRRFADLEWSGAETERVDIYRNDEWVVTVANSGSHSDFIVPEFWSARPTRLEYTVCEAGTERCSPQQTVFH